MGCACTREADDPAPYNIKITGTAGATAIEEVDIVFDEQKQLPRTIPTNKHPAFMGGCSIEVGPCSKKLKKMPTVKTVYCSKRRREGAFLEGRRSVMPKDISMNELNDLLVQHFLKGQELKRFGTSRLNVQKTFEDGSEFMYVKFLRSGQRTDNVRCKGKFTSPSGVVYEGEFLNNVLDGEGIMTLPNGNSYEGNWSDGKLIHCIRVEYRDGNTYEGALEDYKKSGFGAFTWRNGDRYQGMWKDGAMEGPGILYREGKKVIGQWHDNYLTKVISESLVVL